MPPSGIEYGLGALVANAYPGPPSSPKHVAPLRPLAPRARRLRPRAGRFVERLLASARVDATWRLAPSADNIRSRDQAHLTRAPALRPCRAAAEARSRPATAHRPRKPTPPAQLPALLDSARGSDHAKPVALPPCGSGLRRWPWWWRERTLCCFVFREAAFLVLDGRAAGAGAVPAG